MITKRLTKVYPENPSTKDEPQVVVSIQKAKNTLDFSFEVNAHELYVNKDFGLTHSSPGLWDYDVVEVFVTIENPATVEHPTYYEFNVSPLNQFFELKILKPRKESDETYRSHFIRTAEILSQSPAHWRATIQIPYSAIGIKKDAPLKDLILYGNAFACLGRPEARSYWSLFTPVQKNPDFHIPQHFKVLLK